MRIQKQRHLRASVLSFVLTTVASVVFAQAGYERGEARVARANGGAALAQARSQSQAQATGQALAARGRDAQTLAATQQVHSVAGRNGHQHARFEQTVDGLPVYGAYARATFNANGDLVHLIDHLAAVPNTTLPTARVDALQALRGVVNRLHPAANVVLRHQSASGNSLRFDGGRYFWESPSVQAVAVALDDGSMSRGWLVQTWSRRDNQLHHTLVGADGQVLHVESRTNSDSYNVFAKDPGSTAQAVLVGPGAASADSPSGWLGTGAQTTNNISGNNVRAYLDVDANNAADVGGSAVSDGNFVAVANLVAAPTTLTNRAVAVQNLFALNNRTHDILRRHGFNEAAGNFQVNNFGLGGAGNDPVLAEAQDGSGVDNANFSTPNDGSSPRMQMYLWTGAGATHEVVVSPGSATYGAMGAGFGPALSTTGLSGAVVASTPADGCTRIGSAVSGKVALIARGTCDFVTKVLNAQSAGATAVIITNNDTVKPDDIFTMGGTSNRIRISSVMLSLNNGSALRSTAGASATLRKKAVQPVQIDGDLDSDIVFHEYGHGLTWRMIGGMSGPLAGAIGEGMGDGVAMLINGSDRVGVYAASSPLGIRRYPYANYPLTYANVTGAEVHDDGEIYGAIVWRLMELFGAPRRDTLFSYIVDGMNYTPATPTYEAMRDGILAAVAAAPADPADTCTVWRAFAKYGVGVGAKGTVKRSAVTITASSAVPAGCPAP